MREVVQRFDHVDGSTGEARDLEELEQRFVDNAVERLLEVEEGQVVGDLVLQGSIEILVYFSEVFHHTPSGNVGRLVRADDLSSCVHDGVPQGRGDNPVEGVPDNNGSRIFHKGEAGLGDEKQGTRVEVFGRWDTLLHETNNSQENGGGEVAYRTVSCERDAIRSRAGVVRAQDCGLHSFKVDGLDFLGADSLFVGPEESFEIQPRGGSSPLVLPETTCNCRQLLRVLPWSGRVVWTRPSW
mmetsp:Transcript_4198/g.6563  ORF Transcript_4198/g.6563 Transcript_4198/m.6563 type:complete len:241 (-) Transcript_4198:560-1282(-)